MLVTPEWLKLFKYITQEQNFKNIPISSLNNVYQGRESATKKMS